MAESNTKLYDLSLIQSMGSEDPKFEKNIVHLFIDTMPSVMAELTAAHQEQKLELVKKTVHKMKSSIDLMGIRKIKEKIIAIEKLESTGHELNALVKSIEDTLQLVYAQLREIKYP